MENTNNTQTIRLYRDGTRLMIVLENVGENSSMENLVSNTISALTGTAAKVENIEGLEPLDKSVTETPPINLPKKKMRYYYNVSFNDKEKFKDVCGKDEKGSTTARFSSKKQEPDFPTGWYVTSKEVAEKVSAAGFKPLEIKA